ncbi:MAG: RagB/SusD family nutrient uptake outer membrane protein [Schleiferiaceae bacterium]|nr:RagB/SusD family nutrient uptake outer membrane protein [Schleiferiaceae bacterium]
MNIHLKYVITSVALSVTIGSCSRDFLDVKPVGRTLEVNHYQNQEQAFEALVSIYDVLQWNDQNGYTMQHLLMNVASDDTYAGGSDASDQPSWVATNNFTFDPNLGPHSGFWKKAYRGIFRANYYIQLIDDVPNTSEAFKTRTKAEAKFLRAKFYLDLMRFFGNAPLITEPQGADDYFKLNIPGPSGLMTQIATDLTDAILDLPGTVSGNEMGRVTKSAAQALLARAYLFSNDASKMADVASLCEDVINSNLYSLEPNFADIFDRQHEYGVESIFEIAYTESSLQGWWQFGSGGGEGNVGTQFIGMRDYNGPTYATGWGFCPISTDLVSAMSTDPRFTHTVIDAAALQGASYTAGYQNTGYFMKKYAPIQANAALDGDVALNWGTNTRMIRYADVLLMAAEALARTNSESVALGYLNQVRNRVGLPARSSSGAQLLEDIYEERRFELALEGHRFHDLIRTGKAVEVLGSEGYQSHNQWFPIPQNEIDASTDASGNPVLTQNPGYN